MGDWLFLSFSFSTLLHFDPVTLCVAIGKTRVLLFVCIVEHPVPLC